LCAFALVVGLAWPASSYAQPAPITYKVTFPEPEHHWMQVEMTVSGLGAAPLHARMSRSSPGRYAVHEFAKNIFWFEATDSAGKKLVASRPDVDEWLIAGHDGSVRITYRIFGDRADGTYFGVDTTHAHLNMPAAFLWASGLENRSMRVTFAPPAGSNWKVGTQLFPTEDSLTFTAPNLQYFMDSPTEVSNFVLSTFTVPNTDGTPATFRLVTHTDAGQSDVDELAKLVQRLVREEMMVFGEFPKFEPGYYTFLLDYSAWGDGDGMEHRNSTMISEPGLQLSDPNMRRQALDAISHEFFHTWNVERIRPVGLEPFDFTKENITCCLWLAEGFTQYYGDLLQLRAGLSDSSPAPYAISVINGPGRQVRSAVQMSEQAAFDDAATAIDRDDRSRTFITYYFYGAAIAVGLDLSIRERTAGAASLDDYMRLLWQKFGRSAEARAGYVGRPYSLRDLRDVLAELTKDRVFADEFFDKYVEGREVVDYAALFARAGYVLRLKNPEAGWVGQFQVQDARGGVSVNGLVPFGTPAYDAGLDLGDVILTVAGEPATAAKWAALRQRKPGESVALTIRRRDGKVAAATLTIKADPALVIDDLATGGTMTSDQKAFRAAWLGPKIK
jgi:predicted metalloprotease with PDZ domain